MKPLNGTWKIGNVEIPNRVVVAPMAGITNAAFRVTVKEFGAGLVVCEMISDQGIHFRNKKTLEMLYVDEGEHPLSVQIFGGSKETLVEAARFVQENTEADIIDINMGCPVNKVIKAEAGAKWLLDPNKVYEMVEAVSSAVDIPVKSKCALVGTNSIYLPLKMHWPHKVPERQRLQCMVEHGFKCTKAKRIGRY